MRRALVAALLALPLLAEEAPRVPLCVLGTHFLRTEDERALPMATIGSAPEGSATLPPFIGLVRGLEGSRDGLAYEDPACQALVKALTEGTSRLGPPRPGAHALVFLVGPLLNSGEQWESTALSREGNTFTLVVTGWRDNGPRRRNVPTRPTILMTLGELGAGDYELAIIYRGRFLDVNERASHYAMDALHEGSLPFHVVATPEAEGEAVTLPQGALRVREVERGKPDQERPYAGVYRLDMGMGAAPQPAVQAGTFDPTAWANLLRGGPAGPPTLAPPEERGPIHACVTGPRLNSMEWMSLAGATWSEGGVRLVVEVWRDEGARDKNLPYTPLLVIPLDRPPKPGVCRVDVEWRTLHASEPGGLYRYEHDPLLEPVHTDFEVR